MHVDGARGRSAALRDQAGEGRARGGKGENDYKERLQRHRPDAIPERGGSVFVVDPLFIHRSLLSPPHQLTPVLVVRAGIVNVVIDDPQHTSTHLLKSSDTSPEHLTPPKLARRDGSLNLCRVRTLSLRPVSARVGPSPWSPWYPCYSSSIPIPATSILLDTHPLLHRLATTPPPAPPLSRRPVEVSSDCHTLYSSVSFDHRSSPCLPSLPTVSHTHHPHALYRHHTTPHSFDISAPASVACRLSRLLLAAQTPHPRLDTRYWPRRSSVFDHR